MINKRKWYSIALVSVAMILGLISIAGAATFAYITNLASNNVYVIDTTTNTVVDNLSCGLKTPGIYDVRITAYGP